MYMVEKTQVEIKDKFCLTIDEASVYFNIGEKKLRKIIADNLDAGFIIQNGVKFLIKRKQFEEFLRELTAI
jgi:excisionase family DNA binding protein